MDEVDGYPDERLRAWRADTPVCEELIHLNNAGAALMPRPVIDAVHRHLDLETRLGGYEAADAMADNVRDTYHAVANLLGARSRNIAITENATVSFAQAMSAFDFAPGDVIVTTRNDYISNQLLFLSLARRTGVEIHRAADLPEGGVDPDSVAECIRHPRCRLVSVTWVPTNSGLIQPVEAVGAVCRDAGVPYLVDGCQAVGQIPVDVTQLACDYFSATARKYLRGPRGVGFLYVADRALDRGDAPLYIDMRGAAWTEADAFVPVDDAKRFENWEFAYASVLGLGAAVRYALEVGIETAGRRARELAEDLRARLESTRGVRILDRGAERCAITTAAVEGMSGAEIASRLREREINVSATERAFAVLDMDEKGVTSGVRLSPHYYNTASEVEEAASVIAELARG